MTKSSSVLRLPPRLQSHPQPGHRHATNNRYSAGPLGNPSVRGQYQAAEGKWDCTSLRAWWDLEGKTLWMEKAQRRYPGSQNQSGCHHLKKDSLCCLQFYSSSCNTVSADIDNDPVMFYSGKSFMQWTEARQDPCPSSQLLLGPTSSTQQELWCWTESEIKKKHSLSTFQNHTTLMRSRLPDLSKNSPPP